MAHVLLVDDDLILLRVLQFWLTDAGYTVTTHTAPAPALADVAGTAYDLLILDLMLRGSMACSSVGRSARPPPRRSSCSPRPHWPCTRRRPAPPGLMRVWASR
jgi:CheY-like chemotaxis protein